MESAETGAWANTRDEIIDGHIIAALSDRNDGPFWAQAYANSAQWVRRARWCSGEAEPTINEIGELLRERALENLVARAQDGLQSQFAKKRELAKEVLRWWKEDWNGLSAKLRDGVVAGFENATRSGCTLTSLDRPARTIQFRDRKGSWEAWNLERLAPPARAAAERAVRDYKLARLRLRPTSM